MTAKINQCRDCQPKDQWIEIRLVDEMNQPFGSLNGKLIDASGTEHKVMLSGGYLLLTDLPAGPIELKIETLELLNEAKKHKPRSSPQISPAKEYADKHTGYENSKIRHQRVALGDMWTDQPDMPQEHQAGATGTSLKLVTNNSYVVEIKCFSYQECHIAVVGTQYDHNVGNKMTFAAQAIRTLRLCSNQKKVLIIFTPDYTNAQLEAVSESANKFDIEYKLIQDVTDLIASLNQTHKYINPLLSLSFFCHGLPGSLEFGYDLPSSSTMALTLDNFKKIKSSIFEKNGRIDSYACRTGMGNLQDNFIEGGIQYAPEPQISLAQKMADYFCVPVGAYVHRSSYENTWGSSDERHNYEYLKSSGKTDHRAYKYFHEKLQERDDYVKNIRSCYQIDGALNPVHADLDPITDVQYNGRLEFLPE